MADTPVENAEVPAVPGTTEQNVAESIQEPKQETIPKARFDEVYARQKRFEEENARLTETVRALAMQREAPQTREPEPTEPEMDDTTRQVADIIERRLAKKFGSPLQQEVAQARDLAERAAFYTHYGNRGKLGPEMAGQVEGVVAEWRKKNIPGTRQDAYHLLLGREFDEKSAAAPVDNASQRRAVSESDGLPSGRQPRVQVDQVEALSRGEKQAAAFEKLLGDVSF